MHDADRGGVAADGLFDRVADEVGAYGRDFADHLLQTGEELGIFARPHEEPPVDESGRAVGDRVERHEARLLVSRVDLLRAGQGAPGEALQTHPDGFSSPGHVAADVGVLADAGHGLVVEFGVGVGRGYGVDVHAVNVAGVRDRSQRLDGAARGLVDVDGAPGVEFVAEQAVSGGVRLDGVAPPGGFVDAEVPDDGGVLGDPGVLGLELGKVRFRLLGGADAEDLGGHFGQGVEPGRVGDVEVGDRALDDVEAQVHEARIAFLEGQRAAVAPGHDREERFAVQVHPVLVVEEHLMRIVRGFGAAHGEDVGDLGDRLAAVVQCLDLDRVAARFSGHGEVEFDLLVGGLFAGSVVEGHADPVGLDADEDAAREGPFRSGLGAAGVVPRGIVNEFERGADEIDLAQGDVVEADGAGVAELAHQLDHAVAVGGEADGFVLPTAEGVLPVGGGRVGVPVGFDEGEAVPGGVLTVGVFGVVSAAGVVAEFVVTALFDKEFALADGSLLGHAVEQDDLAVPLGVDDDGVFEFPILAALFEVAVLERGFTGEDPQLGDLDPFAARLGGDHGVGDVRDGLVRHDDQVAERLPFAAALDVHADLAEALLAAAFDAVDEARARGPPVADAEKISFAGFERHAPLDEVAAFLGVGTETDGVRALRTFYGLAVGTVGGTPQRREFPAAASVDRFEVAVAEQISFAPRRELDELQVGDVQMAFAGLGADDGVGAFFGTWGHGDKELFVPPVFGTLDLPQSEHVPGALDVERALRARSAAVVDAEEVLPAGFERHAPLDEVAAVFLIQLEAHGGSAAVGPDHVENALLVGRPEGGAELAVGAGGKSKVAVAEHVVTAPWRELDDPGVGGFERAPAGFDGDHGVGEFVGRGGHGEGDLVPLPLAGAFDFFERQHLAAALDVEEPFGAGRAAVFDAEEVVAAMDELEPVLDEVDALLAGSELHGVSSAVPDDLRLRAAGAFPRDGSVEAAGLADQPEVAVAEQIAFLGVERERRRHEEKKK